MKKIGVFEAKTHLSSLIAAVENGESFTITRRNLPIALLTPLEHDVHSRGMEAVKQILRLRVKFSRRLTLEEILQYRNEGRK
ncbi:MAG: type II toxin-antitoxin system prevent-host-death family antitoxin [Pseudomonadales bacterium]|nr:type II toxin-antitoxin system prevent-host-death family antitoxin [Pseudomonadales bacterium]